MSDAQHQALLELLELLDTVAPAARQSEAFTWPTTVSSAHGRAAGRAPGRGGPTRAPAVPPSGVAQATVRASADVASVGASALDGVVDCSTISW